MVDGKKDREDRRMCGLLLMHVLGQKRKERSKLPLCQSQKPIIILNQQWKDTKSCSHITQQWSRPEQLLHN